MSSELTPDELREFLLNKQDLEEEINKYYAPCYHISCDKKKSILVVRIDNKRLLDITEDDLPADMEIHSIELIQHLLGILRESGIEGLKVHLEELKCSEKS